MKRDLEAASSTDAATRVRPRLRAWQVRRPEDLIAVQRLRYRVFAHELGAALDTPFDGLDCDPFDAYCDHLAVSDETTGAVVGTYRVLSAASAAALGRYYAESEFAIDGLARLRPLLGEIGRACIDPAWRNGTVLPLLWTAVLAHLADNGMRFVMGCASIDARDGGHVAAAIHRRLAAECAFTDTTAARPLHPLPIERLEPPAHAELPPLLRGYVRAGATLASPLAFDPAFRTADVLLLLDLRDLAPRFARRFLRPPPGAVQPLPDFPRAAN